MPADDLTAAVPLAGKAFDTFAAVAPMVQIVLAAGLTAIGLVLSAGWAWPRLRPAPAAPCAPSPPPSAASADDGNEDAIALARAIVSLSDELARHVAHLAQAVDTMRSAVERMEDSVLGCKTCPHMPKFERNRT